MAIWLKIKNVAENTHNSVRTARKMLKNGLRHSVDSSGTIYVKEEWLDEYLEGFEVKSNEVDEITDKIIKEMIDDS